MADENSQQGGGGKRRFWDSFQYSNESSTEAEKSKKHKRKSSLLNDTLDFFVSKIQSTAPAILNLFTTANAEERKSPSPDSSDSLPPYSSDEEKQQKTTSSIGKDLVEMRCEGETRSNDYSRPWNSALGNSESKKKLYMETEPRSRETDNYTDAYLDDLESSRTSAISVLRSFSKMASKSSQQRRSLCYGGSSHSAKSSLSYENIIYPRKQSRSAPSIYAPIYRKIYEADEDMNSDFQLSHRTSDQEARQYRDKKSAVALQLLKKLDAMHRISTKNRISEESQPFPSPLATSSKSFVPLNTESPAPVPVPVPSFSISSVSASVLVPVPSLAFGSALAPALSSTLAPAPVSSPALSPFPDFPFAPPPALIPSPAASFAFAPAPVSAPAPFSSPHFAFSPAPSPAPVAAIAVAPSLSATFSFSPAPIPTQAPFPALAPTPVPFPVPVPVPEDEPIYTVHFNPPIKLMEFSGDALKPIGADSGENSSLAKEFQFKFCPPKCFNID